VHFLLVFLTIAAVDLSSIKTEPNLEKRSDLALDYANAALDSARDAYNSGDYAKAQASFNEVAESVDLSWQSLTESGKYARNNGHFKRAELKTRELLRRLDGMADLVSGDDRGMVEKVRARVAQIHDQLIQGIMGKKKK